MSPQTRSSYDATVARLRRFCQQFGIESTHALHSSSIEAFVVFLSQQGLGVGAIQSALSALRHFCNSNNLPFSFDTPKLRLVIRGLKQSQMPSTRNTQALPYSALSRICVAARNILGNKQQMACALFTLAFHGLLRPCEMAKAVATPQHQLRRGSVRFSNRHLRITFLSYKHSSGSTTISLDRLSSGECPWTNLYAYLNLGKCDKQDPLFPCSTVEAKRLLDQCLAAANISTSFTLHAFRRGGATWLSGQGMSDATLRARGRWHSDAFLAYVRTS